MKASRALLILGMVAMSLAFVTATSSGAAKSKGAPHSAKAAAPSVDATVSPIPGICDTAEMLDLLTDLPDGDTSGVALVQGRIVECSRRINATLASLPSPTPSPYWLPAIAVPSPAPTEKPVCTDPTAAKSKDSPFALYATLGRCFAYLTYLQALPTPGPTDSPPPRMASHPTFYVYATGSVEPATAAVLIRSTVERLAKASRAASPPVQSAIDLDALHDVWVQARADWTDNANFATQCRMDPNTLGALVIQTSIPEIYRFNYLVVVANFMNVTASVEMLGCGAEDHNPGVSPLTLFSQQAVSGKAHQTAYQLGLFGALAPVLFPSKSATTVTHNGTTGDTTVKTVNSTSPELSGNLLSGFQGQNLNFPSQDVATQLRVAGERFADATMKRLGAFCRIPQVQQMARDGSPKNVPPPPPERRTIPYKAATQFVNDCTTFGNYAVPDGR